MRALRVCVSSGHFPPTTTVAAAEFPPAPWKIARDGRVLSGGFPGLIALASLLLLTGSSSMSRLPVLSIVLSLALGPDAAAICGLWCAEGPAATESCYHATPASPLVTAGNCCDNAVPTVTVLQAALRVEAPSTNRVPAVLPARDPLIDSERFARPGQRSGSGAAIDARPQTAVLRI